MLLRCAIVLCLTSTTVFTQRVDQPEIKNGDQLVTALLSVCGNDLSCSARILETHKDLVSAEVCLRLILLADSRLVSLPTAFQLALQVASKLDNKPLLASTYYKTGWYQFGQGNIPNAIDNYLRSKELFSEAGLTRDLIYVLADLGTLYIYAGNYDKAKESSEQSLALAGKSKTTNEPDGLWPDQYGMGTALANLGNISKRNCEYEKARQYFQSSLATFEAIKTDRQKYSFKIIDDLWDIGQTYVDEGDYLHALVYLSQSMTMAKESRETARAAGICNSLGILYLNQRDYPKGIDFFQQGLEFAANANDNFKQADILLNIGVAYQFKQDYAAALENFERALELAKQINYSELMVPIYEGMGVVYTAQSRFKEAAAALEAGLELARGNKDKTRTSEMLLRESELELARGNAPKSIEIASEALKFAEPLSLKNVSYLALTTLGKAYRAAGQKNLAIQTFTKAIDQIENMRGQVAGLENERQLFFEDKIVPYHEMIDIFATAKNVDSNSQGLLYAERAKGRVLLDVLSRGRVDFASALTANEKEELARLNQVIANLNLRTVNESIKQPSDKTVMANLKQELQVARLKYEAFQNSLYAAHPNVKLEVRLVPSLTLGRTAELVDAKTAFLEYVVTSEKSYLFCLTKNIDSESLELRVYPIAINENDLSNKAREFRQMIATRDPTFSGSAHDLYTLLIKPAEGQLQNKDRICVIPDGVLWDVPFQALQGEDNSYLLQKYAVYFAPSLNVLEEMNQQRRSNKVTPSLLAFGNPRLGLETATNIKAVYRGESLAPLPEAETEVKALQEIWGREHSHISIGANAGKKFFKAEAPKFSTIHLATHGILDNTNPLYSRLVLSRVENDPSDDGLLEAREIMQLKLSADLVVLSACQTARGRIGAGEGVVGISWAFFLAGVPTTVVSQWRVESASTATLMIDFHRHLKEQNGSRKAEALRQAALDLLKDKSYQHPFYWAGFIIIGRGM